MCKPVRGFLSRILVLALWEHFAMTSVDRALSDQNTNDPATTEAIAKELETDVEVVREIYRQELTALASDAKITQYLGLLVSKRVRMILRQH